MAAYPAHAAGRTAFILGHRPPRPAHDPWRYHGITVEQEPAPEGPPALVATVFLTGRECPWHCVMCDLWRYTTADDTPPGAIAAQVEAARTHLRQSGHRDLSAIKLYNAGSFFDPRAVPEQDYAAIANAIGDLARVVVECHPAFIGPRTRQFADLLVQRATPAPRLEVAMGLETAHPAALAQLNKRMTVDDVRRGAARLRDLGADVRLFLLVAPPFVRAAEQDDWLMRSVELAWTCGASVVSLIPTRTGNGAMEALAAERRFRPPSLDDLERGVALALGCHRPPGARVLADLWDLARHASCADCLTARRDRLHAMNLQQLVLPPISCATCGPGRKG